MPNTAKPIGTRRLQGFQHRRDPLAEVQIGMPDDGRGGAARAVQAAGTRGGLTLDEFDFADGTHFFRSVLAVHRAALDEDRGAHVVTALHVRRQFVQQIALIGNARRATIPEVMMRIADGQLRFQGRLRGQSEPVIASERNEVLRDGNTVSIKVNGERRKAEGGR